MATSCKKDLKKKKKKKAAILKFNAYYLIQGILLFIFSQRRLYFWLTDNKVK